MHANYVIEKENQIDRSKEMKLQKLNNKKEYSSPDMHNITIKNGIIIIHYST